MTYSVTVPFDRLPILPPVSSVNQTPVSLTMTSNGLLPGVGIGYSWNVRVAMVNSPI
jgi:hypothetical protein